MASGKPRFFISYSRADAAFVDRLFTALTGRGNDPWMDRVGLEGGQAFSPELQRQIDQCDYVLALLSPDAIASTWVNNEIVYALSQRKRIIPLSVRSHNPYLPLASINAIDFTNSSRFDAAMDTLMLSYRNLIKPPPPPTPGLPTPPPPTPGLPTPPPPPLDYLKLYQDGLTAQAKGDLETALLYWKQILGPEPRYLNGDLATCVQAVEDQLRPIRIENIKRRAQADFQQGQWADLIPLLANLRELDATSTAAFALDLLHKTADACYRAGRWADKIATWDLIRRWQPQYPHADERRQVAMTNKSQAPRYTVVRQFLAAGNIDLALARSEIQALWQSAPYYGDPENLAPRLGLTVPTNIIDALIQKDRDDEHYRQKKAHADEVERQYKFTRRIILGELTGGLIGSLCGYLFGMVYAIEIKSDSFITIGNIIGASVGLIVGIIIGRYVGMDNTKTSNIRSPEAIIGREIGIVIGVIIAIADAIVGLILVLFLTPRLDLITIIIDVVAISILGVGAGIVLAGIGYGIGYLIGIIMDLIS